VQNSLTGGAIAGASVILGCTQPKSAGDPCVQAQTQTNADGGFDFQNVQPGAYILIPYADHFNNLGKSATVAIAAGQRAAFTTLTLSPESSISGRVMNEAGEPQTDISVTAWRVRRAGSAAVLEKAAQANTDQKGRYTLGDLRRDKYYFSAELPRKSKTSYRGLLFFPGTLSLDEAEAIRIDAGQSQEGMDFTIRGIETHRVSGRVSGLQNEKNIELSLEPVFAVRASVLLQKVGLQADGSFYLDNVPPGSYVIRLRSSASLPTVHQLAALRVDVGHTNVNGVSVIAVPPVEVSGHVLSEASPLSDLSQVKVTLRPVAFEASSEIKRATVSKDGAMSFSSCDAAKYLVRVLPPAGFYVASVEFNRQDALSHIIDLSNGTSGDLVVKVAMGSAELGGRIQTDATAPPAVVLAKTVMLFADSWSPEVTADVPSYYSKDGNYTFTSQAPGRYAIVAVEWSDGSWPLRHEPELIRYFQSKGTKVELKVGDHQQMDVPLISDGEIMQTLSRLGLN
jgi:hypothetical protein